MAKRERPESIDAYRLLYSNGIIAVISDMALLNGACHSNLLKGVL
ncbi:MAG: hypothetical protein UV38_C0001G0296 [candidate division TM6 bacterium GW2011_GWE2_42_60]|nr:MAG: hypothetical protein UV38_C0001G0296 [candidate division TM6 bacterium GW2011_GWE2_42_60]